MQAALSLRSDARFLPHTIFLCFYPIPISPSSYPSSPSLFLSRHVPPSSCNVPLPPPSQFEIPACCLPYVNNYLLPTESNYAKRAYFFSSLHILELLKPGISLKPVFGCLNWIEYEQYSSLLQNEDLKSDEMYRAEKAVGYFELDFFQKNCLKGFLISVNRKRSISAQDLSC